ncbi:MAG: alanine--tRNA ligase [Candidatus Aenigmarchaeota archaeon]|nr:alanine--tRNA ligase [Candidatus Aenigmarchaeota archaeon]
MLTKDGLRKEFGEDWKRHYELEIFKEKGFSRKKCSKCGRNFWTTDNDRTVCSDSSCEDYGFINNTITKGKMDYIETWKAFEKFFKNEGHKSVKRYPVVDRWRPDLFFTIASIQDFQRIDEGKMTMEYPADPLIVPQMCLRFNDIPNVGVTGRHHTSFIMGGQHSFGNYWKDRCIELNFNFLNGVMGIPEDKLIYMEDVWSMPDFSQFGPCIETFSMGLELVNSVFSQFTKYGERYTELPQKVIDVGWGHERLVWFSNGTFNGYEAVFGPVIDWMKKQSCLHADDLFERYSKLAGGLDFDEVRDIRNVRIKIAEKLGVDVNELEKIVGPMQALYAIADHVKTLLFAITDGGIPSNVGGGYNLRILLRRSLSFMSEFNFDFEIPKIAEMHAAFLKPLFPELSENLDMFSTIYKIEKERYENTMERSRSIIAKEVKTGKVDHNLMEKLYVSHGITPEIIEKEAGKEGIKLDIPEDFYTKITDKHMSQDEPEEKAERFQTEGLEKTKFLFYENPYTKTFESEVVKVVNNEEGKWVILKETLFYPEGGGQPYDIGKINGKDVKKVEKLNGVAFHLIDSDSKIGEKVKGEINWERRYELMKMHTGTHIVSGSARKLFGHHVWQAGAQKGLESSRIDLTHFLPFSHEDLEKIERLANDIIQKGLPIDSVFMDRKDAESNFGFVLYQGGASPGKSVRVVNIHDKKDIFDVEACGGTHLTNTKEAEMIKIIKSERIQDGVNRVDFVAGKAALLFIEKEKKIFDKTISRCSGLFGNTINIKNPADHYAVSEEIQKSSEIFSVSRDMLFMAIEKFVKDIEEQNSKTGASIKDMLQYIGCKKIQSLSELSKAVFDLWKYQKKLLEKEMINSIDDSVDKFESEIRSNKLIKLVSGDRKFMINLAQKISENNPEAIIIFANSQGDAIAKSGKGNAKQEFDKILEKCEGTGGGKADFVQGKLNPDLFKKLILN